MTELSGKAALAAEAWGLLFDFIMRTRHQRDAILARVSLTPNDARALASLEPGAGRTMRSLAEEWGCDASNATWIVDRLEDRGLARRRGNPADRRVKMVELTAKGERIRTEVREGVYQPPPELLELSVADLQRLRDGLAKLTVRS